MTYPTKEELTEWFSLQETGNAPKFFDLYVSDDVIWTVEVFNWPFKSDGRELFPSPGYSTERKNS
jgi:hypothetical protein